MSDERSIPGRVLALNAIVRLAIDEAHTESDGWGYGPDIETSEIVRAVDDDVSERTVLRAAKDAAALGWITDEIEGWDVGPRAEEFYPAVDLPGETVE